MSLPTSEQVRATLKSAADYKRDKALANLTKELSSIVDDDAWLEIQTDRRRGDVMREYDMEIQRIDDEVRRYCNTTGIHHELRTQPSTSALTTSTTMTTM